MKYAQKMKGKRKSAKQWLLKWCEKANGHVANKNYEKDSIKQIKEFETEYRMTSREFFFKYEDGKLGYHDDDFPTWFRLLGGRDLDPPHAMRA